MNHHTVFLCNNDNLRDRKYRQRRDNLHLTDAGTSRLANNLKYTIAESLDSQVVKKQWTENNKYRNRCDRREHTEHWRNGYNFNGISAKNQMQPSHSRDEHFWNGRQSSGQHGLTPWFER